MNTGFYENLDKNFEEAYKLSEINFSHEELITLLETGNIPQKQIAALKFDKICNQDDADILMQNLTGCDGKIREAVALKIYQFISNDEHVRKFFISDTFAEIFSNATIDINANICRLVVDSVKFLKFNKTFSELYSEQIRKFVFEAFDELDKFIFRDKKYVINKQLFKLYWCLETLKNFYEYISVDEMLKILEKSSLQSEYTIREKTAEISVLSPKFDKIRLFLENDDNYYVKTVFKNTKSS